MVEKKQNKKVEKVEKVEKVNKYIYNINMNTIFIKAGEDYHGGYLLQQNTDNNYLGGKKSIISRYDKMIIPFGLFYKNRINDLHQYAANRLLDEKESECIEPDLFDRLFFAVGKVELPKKEKYTDNNKTKRIYK